MGFSVSGATVILFIGAFISFSIAYGAVNNGVERVSDAYQEDTDRVLEQKNTALNITDTTVANTGTGLYLNLTVNNTGATSLDVEDTDVLVDGSFVTGADVETEEIDGDGDTDLWLPGESLFVNVSVATEPERVKVVTGPGVAETEVI